MDIVFDANKLRDAFAKLGRLRKRPLLIAIAELLRNDAEDRINAGGPAPDGAQWKPAPYKRGSKVLVFRGYLRDSLYARATETYAEVGSGLSYAAIHQFGGKTPPRLIKAKKGVLRFNIGGAVVFAKSVQHPGSVIPARPYLGISASSEERIEELAEDYLALPLK